MVVHNFKEKASDTDCVILPNTNDSTALIRNYATKQTKIRIFDMLDSSCSYRLACFLRSHGFAVMNDSKNIQKGLSCGYISASCASRFFSQVYHKNEQWFDQDIFDCAYPDVTLMNQLLDIPGNTAVQLTAEQIMKLVCFITNDNDLNWLFMVDINLFMKMAENDFNNLSLPKLNGKRWAVFCINDAEIREHEVMQIIHTNEFRGTHWFTVALWI